jgi:5,10-methylenetetrahydromethanopterin reductase
MSARPGRGGARPAFAVDLEVHPALPSRECIALVREAEELGFDTIWFADSHMIWRDAFVVMGAVAGAGGDVNIGTGVSNTITRHPTVVASALATLEQLRPGRVFCGLGIGDSAVYTLGLKPMKRRVLEEHVALLRALWRKEPCCGETGQPIALEWLERPITIPIYYGSSGPNMLEDAGRLCDGVVSYVGLSAERIRVALRHIEAGAAASSRRLTDLAVVWWVPFCVSHDAARARDGVKPHVARAVLHAEPLGLPADEQAVADDLKHTYDWYRHMAAGSEHSRIVPDRIVERYAVAGTPAECVEQLKRLQAHGIDHVGIIPMGNDRREIIKLFAAEVLPGLQP